MSEYFGVLWSILQVLRKSYWNSPYLEPTHIILMTAWTHFWTLGIKGESTFGSSLVLYLHNNLTISRESLIFWILSVHDLPPRRWWHSVCRLFSKAYSSEFSLDVRFMRLVLSQGFLIERSGG